MLNNTIIDRIKLPFRKEKELFSSLYHIIGFYPRHIEYYKLALMHKSASKRNAKGRPLNNERLEFLGDAILDAVVGDIVYRHFEGKREGFLTNTRSKLVQRDTLNKLAEEMGLCQLIRSAGRTTSHNSYMGGNAFEALVGAIYLDRGYDACMQFMEKRILKQVINIDKVAYKEVNFKSKLIEWSQKNRVRLDFKLVEQHKENNASPVFCYRATLEGLEAGEGKGYSKKESQQIASKETLQKLRREPQFIDSVFAAKSQRTKMEEEPTEMVPDTSATDDFFEKHEENRSISTPEQNSESPKERKFERRERAAAKKEDPQMEVFSENPKRARHDKPEEPAKPKVDEFDLSDITALPKEDDREDIVAKAMAAAFEEGAE